MLNRIGSLTVAKAAILVLAAIQATLIAFWLLTGQLT